MPHQPVLAPELLATLGTRPVPLTLDQVDQLGFDGAEIEVAFAAVFVEEGGGFVADEEAQGGEGEGVAGGVAAGECLRLRLLLLGWEG